MDFVWGIKIGREMEMERGDGGKKWRKDME
jgi:hypothetical protein